MAKLRLTGDTSGFTEVSSPAVAGNANIILPSGVGQANQFLRNTGTSGTLGWSNVIETATGVGINTTAPDANLSVSGVASFAGGTSGTPSIASFGDLNTGIYFPSADTVAFTAGGNESSRINNSGILLVGTTNANGTAKVQVSGDVLVNSINSGPLAGMRNAIINGNFDFWQRGTSFSNPANATYTSDRWEVAFNGTGSTRTISRQSFTVGQTDVPGEPTYFLRFAQSVAGSGSTFTQLDQRIEDVRTFAGQQITISFWAKAAANTTMSSIAVQQSFGTGGSPSSLVGTNAATNIALTTTWQKFSYQVNVPSISGKTLGTDNNSSLILVFAMPLNDTFTIDIAQVQVERGPVATPFERRPQQTELALCQRYYWRGQTSAAFNFPSYAIGSVGSWVTPFHVTMRATPTVNYDFTGATLSNCSVNSYSGATVNGARMTLVSSAINTNVFVSLVAANYFEASSEL